MAKSTKKQLIEFLEKYKDELDNLSSNFELLQNTIDDSINFLQTYVEEYTEILENENE